MGKLNTFIKGAQTVGEVAKHGKTIADATSSFRAADKGDIGRSVGRHAFHETTDIGKTAGKSWLKTFEVIPRLVCRGLQLLFALIACGFYGNRVDSDRRDGDDGGFAPEWLYAITIAGLSAVTAVLFTVVLPLSAVPILGSKVSLFKTYRAFGWDLFLFIAWIVTFGIFAGIFLKRDNDDEYKGANTRAMKAAVWIDFVNVILWLVSGVYGAIKTCLGERVDRVTDKVSNKMFDKKGPKDHPYTEMDERV